MRKRFIEHYMLILKVHFRTLLNAEVIAFLIVLSRASVPMLSTFFQTDLVVSKNEKKYKN